MSEIAGDVELGITGRRFILIEPPVMPLGPDSPNRRVILLLGVILALGAGVACVVGAEILDDSIRSTKRLADIVGSPPIAVSPYLNNRADVVQARNNKILIIGSTLAIVALCVAYVTFIVPQL